MSQIDTFKQHLKGGGARPNIYKIIVPLKFGGDSAATTSLEYLCRAAALPPSTSGVIAVPFRGRFLKLVGERTFEPWTITVLNDTSFNIRNAFERWSNLMNNHGDAMGETVLANYKVDIDVIQLDKSGKILKTYKLIGAFPTNISQIDLDAEATDQIESFTVEFEYDYWVSDTTTPAIESSAEAGVSII